MTERGEEGFANPRNAAYDGGVGGASEHCTAIERLNFHPVKVLKSAHTLYVK